MNSKGIKRQVTLAYNFFSTDSLLTKGTLIPTLFSDMSLSPFCGFSTYLGDLHGVCDSSRVYTLPMWRRVFGLALIQQALPIFVHLHLKVQTVLSRYFFE